MPTPNDILTSLSYLATKYDKLAMTWHIILLVTLSFAIYKRKFNTRIYYGLVGLLFTSVAVMAAIVTNPFNLVLFLVPAFLFIRKALTIISSTLYFTQHSGTGVLAYLFIMSGLVYPHFLGPGVVRYIVAAPVGIIPCPTLLVSSGIMLLFTVQETKLNYLLTAVNVFYGIVGVFYLGVSLDVLLLLAAIIQIFQLHIYNRVPAG